jgi:urease gamma subunit
MKLSPREKDKLLVSMAAMVARNRQQRGVKLNYPEAVALITDYVVEGRARWPFSCSANGSWRPCCEPR